MLAATHENRSRYMEDVIREADRRIKADAHQNHEHEGMGSTLIMAWLAGTELSISWIGDSRAYRFNPDRGLEPLSRDHSYVQELADKGILTYEQTFEHPQGNIVTRSLGDNSQKARPESRLFKVHDGDIILLCSDGLSGVLRDSKASDEEGNLYPGENIEDIIRENSSSLSKCREALWAAAERADWYDNVTAILCEIRSGAGKCNPIQEPSGEPTDSNAKVNISHKTFDGLIIKIPRKKFLPITLLLLFVIICISCGLLYKFKNQIPEKIMTAPDTTIISQPKDSENTAKPINAAPVKASKNIHAEKKKIAVDREAQKKDTVKTERKETLPFKLEPIKSQDTSKTTPAGDKLKLIKRGQSNK